MPYDTSLTSLSRMGNLDRYFVRVSILKAINSLLTHFKGELLDIGCGKAPYKKYLLKNSKITNEMIIEHTNEFYGKHTFIPDEIKTSGAHLEIVCIKTIAIKKKFLSFASQLMLYTRYKP